MVSRHAAASTAGVRYPLPEISLPPDLSLDPIRVVETLLENGLGPEQAFPRQSEGLQSLLSCTKLWRERGDEKEAARQPELASYRRVPSRFKPKPTEAATLAQEAFRRQIKNLPNAPRSAIRRHGHLAGLVTAAQHSICQPGWFFDPCQVVIGADEADVEEMMRLLRMPMQDKDRIPEDLPEDPFESARWIAEELMAPRQPIPWRFNGPLPVRLAYSIGPDDSFREVHLSPRCWLLSGPELLPAVRAARVGLHFVRQSA